MRRVKAVTLLEIIIVVVVLAVLATIALPTYTNAIENARAEACAANLSAIKAALNIYVLDNDTIPGELGQIPQKYFDQAYASLLRGKDGWRIRLAKALVNFDDRGRVYAGLMTELSKGNSSVLQCPSAAGGISYGINGKITPGMFTSDFKTKVTSADFVVGDCAAETFASNGDFAARHKHVSLVGGTTTFANGVKSLDPAGVITVVRVPGSVARGPLYSETSSAKKKDKDDKADKADKADKDKK